MNQRIKVLLEQTGGFVDINQFLGGEKGCVIYTYEGLEKFAESIVRECMAIAQDYDGCKLSGAGTIIANRIDVHFEVNEE